MDQQTKKVANLCGYSKWRMPQMKSIVVLAAYKIMLLPYIASDLM